MIQKEFKEIVFEFAKKASDLDNVLYVFLFGSVAKEEADRRSDIDLCVIISNSDRKKISSIALDLEKKYDKNIQLVISKNFTKLDNYFIKQLFKEGILLYAKKPIIKLKDIMVEEVTLFSFSLENLDQSEKMKVKRILYGYSTSKKKDKKIYKSFSKGLIKELNGSVIGRGAILIPIKNTKHIEKVFNEKRIKFKREDLFKVLI